MRLPSPRLLHTLLVLAALLALSQLIDAGRLFERRSVPREWLSVRRASPASSVHFVVGLRSASEAAMADTFWSISEPSSQRYLQLLSEHDIEQRFGASAADRQLVTQWLLAAGVSESSMQHVSSAIEVSTSAEVAERLFATEMRLFRHATSGKQVVKAWGTAELPEHIHVAVDIVTGLSSFPIPRRARIRSQRGSDEQPELVVPQTIRAMYTVRPQQAGSSSATQAVIEFAPQYFSNADTAIFAAAVGYTAANATLAAIPDEHIVGTNVPTFAGIEAALDVEMIAATNLEVQTWFWIEAGGTWMYEYALHALNSSSRPQVVSISWGWYEGLQCHFDAAECELLDVDGRPVLGSDQRAVHEARHAGSVHRGRVRRLWRQRPHRRAVPGSHTATRVPRLVAVRHYRRRHYGRRRQLRLHRRAHLHAGLALHHDWQRGGGDAAAGVVHVGRWLLQHQRRHSSPPTNRRQCRPTSRPGSTFRPRRTTMSTVEASRTWPHWAMPASLSWTAKRPARAARVWPLPCSPVSCRC